MAQLEELRVSFTGDAKAGADAAAAALTRFGAAAEKATAAVSETDQAVRRSGTSVEALSRKYIEADRATAAMEAAQRKHARALADLAREESSGAVTAQRAADLRSNIARQIEVDAARIAAASERRIEAERRLLTGGAGAVGPSSSIAAAERDLNRFASANDNAVRSSGRFNGALVQVGYQVQDVATQIAMGQNAMMAFGVQFAQLAGFFGTGGALLGAVAVLGVVGAQFLGGADAAKQLNDAMEAQQRLFQDANTSARAYGEGLQEQAEGVQRLRGYYASLGASVQEFEQRNLTSSANALRVQRDRMSGLIAAPITSAAEAQRGDTMGMDPLGNATGFISQGSGQLTSQLAQAQAAVEEFYRQTIPTRESVAELSNRLASMGEVAGMTGEAIRQAREALVSNQAALIQTGDALRQHAIQTVAVMQAQGAGRDAIEQYAARFGNLALEILKASDSLRTLRRIAAENPFAAMEQDAARTEAQLAALRTGGLDALAQTRERQAVETAGAEANRRVYDEQIKVLRELGLTQQESEERAAQAAQAAQLRAEQQVRNTQALTRAEREAEEARRKAEEAARRGRTQAEQEARRLAAEQDRIARRGGSVYEYTTDPRQTVFPVADIQAAWDRNRQQSDREAQQARQAAEREGDRLSRQFDTVTNNFGQSIAQATFDGLEAGAARGESVLSSLASSFGSIMRQAAVQGVAAAVVTPGIRSLASSIGYTGADSGQGSLLSSLGQITGLSSLLPTGGLSGITSSINSWGASTFPSLFGGGYGFDAFAEAAPSSMGLGGGSLMGSLGSAAGGFAIGSTLGSFTAGGSAARQTNGMVGAGLGTAAGFFLPGGPLVWGGIGGALGGLIGPGDKTNAFGFTLASSGGQFGLDGLSTTGDGAGGNEAYAQAQAQIAQANAALAAAGLSVNDNRRAITGGGDRPTDGSQSASFAEALTTFRFGSANENVNRALAARPDAGLEGSIAVAQWVTNTYEALSDLDRPAGEINDRFAELSRVFGAAIAEADSLSLSTTNLMEAQARANAEVKAAQVAGYRQLTEGITVDFFNAVGMSAEAALLAFDLSAERSIAAFNAEMERLGASAEDTAIQLGRLTETQEIQRANLQREQEQRAQAETAAARATGRGLLESLSFGDLSGALSPDARSMAARAALTSARAALNDGATPAEVDELARVARLTVPIIQQIEGITPDLGRILADLAGVAGTAAGGDTIGLQAVVESQVSVGEQISAAVYAAGGDTRAAILALQEEFRRSNIVLTAMAARLQDLAA